MRFASDDGEIRFGIPVGSIDAISIGQEILELNYDRAIAALYFPRLIQSTWVFVTVTPSSDLMPLSSRGFCELYFLVNFICFFDLF